MEKDLGCIFCKIVAGELPAAKLYEDDKTLAFMDINPINDGHALIIPKAHRETLFEMDADTLSAVSRTTLKVATAVKEALAPEGLNIFQANGAVAGQTVFHFHFHVLPRNSNDRLKITLHGNPTIDQQDIQQLAENIRQAISVPADQN